MPGDVPLFDLGDVPAPEPPRRPMQLRSASIAAPASYEKALERTGGQCEVVATPKDAKPRRCYRSMEGGHRLYLGEDGVLRCEGHAKAAEKENRPPRPRRPRR
jgi:hypothetical protein